MIKHRLFHLINATIFFAASSLSVQAATYQDATLGGVNLTPWCKSKFGSNFKAKLIGKTAGDWTCEQSSGNRRPISVKSACQKQYGKRAYKAQALDWNDPYSWKCFLK